MRIVYDPFAVKTPYVESSEKLAVPFDDHETTHHIFAQT